jgi:hypothetical protein
VIRVCLLAFLFTFFFLSGFSQDSISIRIHGTVRDSTRSLALPNSGLRVYNDNQMLHKLSTNNSGAFDIQIRIPKGRNHVTLLALTTNYLETQIDLDSNLQSSIDIKADLILTPQRVCWDSFLPEAVYFEENAIELSKDQELLLLKEFFRMNEQMQSVFYIKRLEIMAYCDYTEKYNIAEKRMLYIYNLAVEAGLNKNYLRVKIYGKKDLFICDYCDGCHFFYLKGQGTSFTKKLYSALETEEEQEAHRAKRRTVQFNWTHLEIEEFKPR